MGIFFSQKTMFVKKKYGWKEFAVTKHSKICSKHFSPSQSSRLLPRLAELGYPNIPVQPKEDTVPDVPWAINSESTRGIGMWSIQKRRN